MGPDGVVRLLAEPARLRAFAALVLGARSPSEVVDATGLGVREVGVALRRLADGGLVDRTEDGLVPNEGVLAELARDTAEPTTVEDHGYTDQKIENVVRTFIRDGRLLGLPAQRGRRRIVLEHLVQSFEPGVRYDERTVDVTLRAWCGDKGDQTSGIDHVSVRRYLVDEGLLTRENGVYWRSGGWIDVLG